MNRIKEQFILWQIRKGNHNAFGEIYLEYYDAIGRYIKFRIKRNEDAEDIANSVFLKCFEYIKDNTKQNVEHVRGFLYHVARVSIAEYYRKDQKREISVADPALVESDDRSNQLFVGDDETDEYEQRQHLKERALKDLKPEYREVILMRYNDDMAIEDIARVLSKSEGTVRVLLHRARTALKKQIHSLS